MVEELYAQLAKVLVALLFGGLSYALFRFRLWIEARTQNEAIKRAMNQIAVEVRAIEQSLRRDMPARLTADQAKQLATAARDGALAALPKITKKALDAATGGVAMDQWVLRAIDAEVQRMNAERGPQLVATDLAAFTAETPASAPDATGERLTVTP